MYENLKIDAPTKRAKSHREKTPIIYVNAN